MEGANTAFQVHLRVAPEEFARVYNAALIATAPALAAAGNSPTFLGHRLWEETRVALFTQAGDTRPPDRDDGWEPPARINFGTGWMRMAQSSSSARASPCTTRCCRCWASEDAEAVVDAGGVPSWPSCACITGPCGTGTAPSTIPCAAATCASSCAPCPPGRP